MPKQTSSVEQCIRAYLKEHDGSAPAGDVTAHAVAAGHAPSTVRRVANRVVTKTRTGNTFTWTIRAAPTFAPIPEQPSPVDVPSRPGILRDTSRKPSLWDAMQFNGQRIDPRDLHTPATVQRTTPARREIPDPAPDADERAFDSPHARLSQGERMHMIRARPTLEPWTDGFPELTDIEAIVLLEADDAGLIDLPETTARRTTGSNTLPY